MEFPRFQRSDIMGWIQECERYFELEGTPDNWKVQLASGNLDERGYIWHLAFEEEDDDRPISWQKYKHALMVRFGSSYGRNMSRTSTWDILGPIQRPSNSTKGNHEPTQTALHVTKKNNESTANGKTSVMDYGLFGSSSDFRGPETWVSAQKTTHADVSDTKTTWNGVGAVTRGVTSALSSPETEKSSKITSGVGRTSPFISLEHFQSVASGFGAVTAAANSKQSTQTSDRQILLASTLAFPSILTITQNSLQLQCGEISETAKTSRVQDLGTCLYASRAEKSNTLSKKKCCTRGCMGKGQVSCISSGSFMCDVMSGSQLLSLIHSRVQGPTKGANIVCIGPIMKGILNWAFYLQYSPTRCLGQIWFKGKLIKMLFSSGLVQYLVGNKWKGRTKGKRMRIKCAGHQGLLPVAETKRAKEQTMKSAAALKANLQEIIAGSKTTSYRAFCIV